MVRKKIGRISQEVTDITDAYISNNPPPNNMLRKNMLWIDNAIPDAKVLKQYDGSTWNTLSYDFESSIPVSNGKDIEDYVLTLGNIFNDSKINYYERLKLKDVFLELMGDGFLKNGGNFETYEEIVNSSAEKKSLIWIIDYYAGMAHVSTDNIKARYNEFKTHMESYTSPKILDTTIANKFSDVTILSVTAYRNAWINLITAIRDTSVEAQGYWDSYNMVVKGEINETPNRNMLRNSDFYIKDNVINKPLGAWKDFYKDNSSGTSGTIDISTEINGIDFKNAYRIIGQSSTVVGIQLAPLSLVKSEIMNYNGKSLAFSGWKKSSGVTGTINCRVVIKGKDSTGAVANLYYPLVQSSVLGAQNTKFEKVSGYTALISIPSTWTEVTGMYFDLHMNGAVGTLDVTGLKLEVGRWSTKWIPNNLDFDEKVKGSTFTITPEGITSMVFNSTQWSSFVQKVDSIQMEVANNAGEISRVEQKANSIESTVQNQQGQITTISQKADRVDIVVNPNGTIKAQDIASSIAVTSSAINLISQNINLTGRVTFSTFDSSLQNSFNTTSNNASTALSTANYANSTAISANNKIISLGNSDSTTKIHGGNIITGTISANVINSGTLNSIQINNGNGTFTVSPTGAMTATNATISGTNSSYDTETGLSATDSVNISNARIVVQQYGGNTNSVQTITMSGNTGLEFTTSKSSGQKMRIDIYESESTSSRGVFKIHASGSNPELRIISEGSLVVRSYSGITLANSTAVQGSLTVSSTARFSSYVFCDYGLDVGSSNGLVLSSGGRIAIGSTEIGSTYYNGVNIDLSGELRLTSSGIIRGFYNEIHIAGRFNSSQSYGHLRVTSTSSGGFVQSESMYSQTTTASANLYVQDSGHIKRVSSSLRYKINIEEQPLEKSRLILNLSPKTWHDKLDSERYAEYLTKVQSGETLPDSEWKQCDPIKRIGGLIAEEVEETGLKEYVFYGEDGKTVEGLMYDRLWTLLIPIVREHDEKVAMLENRIAELESIIAK